jgi:hypothetical protein
VVVATNTNLVVLLQLPSLSKMAEFPVQGQITAMKAFDGMADTLFFGIKEPLPTGVENHCIRVMSGANQS